MSISTLFSNRSSTTALAHGTRLIAVIGAAAVLTTGASASPPPESGPETVIGQQQAFDVTTVIDDVPTTVLNDTTSGPGLAGFTYEGSWQTTSGARGRYLGDDHYAAGRGSRYTIRFHGTQLRIAGARARHHGKATVTIDGASGTVIDQYAPVREDNVVVYTSPVLPDGEHVAVVTVAGTHLRGSTGNVIAVDRAVVTHAALPAVAPPQAVAPLLAEPLPVPSPSVTAPASPPPSPSSAVSLTRPSAATTGAAVFSESGEGAEQRRYASRDSNGQHSLWSVEPGSSPVHRAGGKIIKKDDERFHRMFSTQRYGGPGTSLEISYRARATAIRHRGGSSLIAGAKIGLKFPVAESLTGYSKDDPRSVYGGSSQHDAAGPGSYAFRTGLTEDGYMELARNGYGGEGYDFFDHKSVGYTPGEWKDVVVKVDWLATREIRVRYWHNADAAGAPVYEATDANSPFWDEPGFLWLRTDDTDWEYESLTVHER